jgi:aminopeptidase 2
VIDEAHKRFQRFMAGDESALHPDIRGAVFGIVVKTGTDANFESVFKFYRESSVADQKLMALSALGSTTNVAAIERLLEMTVTEKDIRPQDIIYVYRALSLNTVSRRPFWQFVKTNYDKLAERHRSSPQILMAIIKSSASTFASQKDADDIKAFFDARDHRNVARSVQQSLEKVQSNAAWLERAKNEVSAWLTKHVQS